MALDRLYLFVFVVYCTTVGTVLVMMPWSPAWDQLLLYLPFEDIRLLQSSWFRGLLAGFGLVHLVWSVHDLNWVLNPSLMDPSDGGASERPADDEASVDSRAD